MIKSISPFVFGFLLILPALSFAQLTDAQYTTKLKDLKSEGQRILKEYNRQKEDFEKEINNGLKNFWNSPQYEEKRRKYLEKAEANRQELKAAYIAKMEVLKETENELRESRYGGKHGEPTPEEKKQLYQSQLKNENKAMEEFKERIKRQDEEIQAEQKALKLKKKEEKAGEREPVVKKASPKVMPPEVKPKEVPPKVISSKGSMVPMNKSKSKY